MKGELLALAALALFSLSIIVTRLGSSKLPLNAAYLVTVSVNIAFSALWFGVELLLRRDTLRWDAYAFLLFVVAGGFSTYLGRWFILESITRLGPAKASAFQVSSPLFAFVFAWIFMGERLSATAVFAMILTALGLLLVSLSHARANAPAAAIIGEAGGAGGRARARFAALWKSGILLGLGSSVAYAAGNVLRGTAIRIWDEAVLGALIGALSGIALHFVFSSDRINVMRSLRSSNRAGVVLFAVSGAATIVAQTLVLIAMATTPVAVVALITVCTPLIVFPISYFFLNNEEGINGATLVGGLLTLAGIAIDHPVVTLARLGFATMRPAAFANAPKESLRMEMTNSRVVPAPPAAVWAALNDPAALQASPARMRVARTHRRQRMASDVWPPKSARCRRSSPGPCA